MPKFIMTLEVDVADYRVTTSDVKEHVLFAVNHWGGQHAPEHPFFPDNMNAQIKGRITKEK